ncbi:hypothetical protein BUE67_13375, partial [Corynebacterium diphtheriae]
SSPRSSVFAGCHCGDGMYQGADSWKNAWNQATKMNTVDAKLTAQWNWKPSFEEARTPEWSYQFDVQDVGGSVWTGGTEHLISQYTKDNFTRLSSSITKDGGDFQDLSSPRSSVFAGCHCGDGMYQGADSWKNAWNQAT